MQCLKCGKTVSEKQSFCDACLEVIEKYPVKPGTPVHILPRTPKEKAPKKRELSLEDLLAKQKRKNRRQRNAILILCLILICAFCGLAYFLFPYFKNLSLPTPPM